MSAFDPESEDRDGIGPAPWFKHRDDDESDQEDSNRRAFIIAAASLVVFVLLLIPVLQAAVLQRQEDSLPDDEYRRTALQFASAVYFARSTGQAMLFATDEADDDIEDVVSYFREWPPNSSQARVQISAKPCPRDAGDATECFLGALFDPGAGFVPGIEFGIAEREGDPRVVFVRLDQTTVRAAPLNRS